MTSHALTLLSTAHCSLCEQAFDLLASMPELRGSALRVLDIADDAALVERYGERLPVLLVEGHELTWPFDAAAIVAVLAR
ncbi:MAG: glutaredoxin family protein [Pseudomonadales bacterium]